MTRRISGSHNDRRRRRLNQAYRIEESPPPQYAWEHTWWGVALQVVLLIVLMFGIPFVLWLALAGPAR